MATTSKYERLERVLADGTHTGEYVIGNLIEEKSEDCGYDPTPVKNVSRYVRDDSETYCGDGNNFVAETGQTVSTEKGTKYVKIYREDSIDGGWTWIRFGSSGLAKREMKSLECGWEDDFVVSAGVVDYWGVAGTACPVLQKSVWGFDIPVAGGTQFYTDVNIYPLYAWNPEWGHVTRGFTTYNNNANSYAFTPDVTGVWKVMIVISGSNKKWADGMPNVFAQTNIIDFETPVDDLIPGFKGWKQKDNGNTIMGVYRNSNGQYAACQIGAFEDCTYLNRISTDITGLGEDGIRMTVMDDMFLNCLNAAGSTVGNPSMASGAFAAYSGVTSAKQAFRNFGSMGDNIDHAHDWFNIPSGLLDAMTGLTDVERMFYACDVREYPSHLFSNNKLITQFSECFGSKTTISGNQQGEDFNFNMDTHGFYDTGSDGNEYPIFNRVNGTPGFATVTDHNDYIGGFLPYGYGDVNTGITHSAIYNALHDESNDKWW